MPGRVFSAAAADKKKMSVTCANSRGRIDRKCTVICCACVLSQTTSGCHPIINRIICEIPLRFFFSFILFILYFCCTALAISDRCKSYGLFVMHIYVYYNPTWPALICLRVELILDIIINYSLPRRGSRPF